MLFRSLGNVTDENGFFQLRNIEFETSGKIDSTAIARQIVKQIKKNLAVAGVEQNQLVHVRADVPEIRLPNTKLLANARIEAHISYGLREALVSQNRAVGGTQMTIYADGLRLRLTESTKKRLYAIARQIILAPEGDEEETDEVTTAMKMAGTVELILRPYIQELEIYGVHNDNTILGKGSVTFATELSSQNSLAIYTTDIEKTLSRQYKHNPIVVVIGKVIPVTLEFEVITSELRKLYNSKYEADISVKPPEMILLKTNISELPLVAISIRKFWYPTTINMKDQIAQQEHNQMQLKVLQRLEPGLVNLFVAPRFAPRLAFLLYSDTEKASDLQNRYNTRGKIYETIRNWVEKPDAQVTGNLSWAYGMNMLPEYLTCMDSKHLNEQLVKAHEEIGRAHV